MNDRILVVDDQQSVRATMEDALVESGYSVRTAESAEEALKLFIEGFDVSLIISDYRMPEGMNGFEFWKRLKQLSVEVPFILMTGDLTPELQEQTMAAGIPTLIKPVSERDLLRMVDLLLNR